MTIVKAIQSILHQSDAFDAVDFRPQSINRQAIIQIHGCGKVAVPHIEYPISSGEVSHQALSAEPVFDRRAMIGTMIDPHRAAFAVSASSVMSTACAMSHCDERELSDRNSLNFTEVR